MLEATPDKVAGVVRWWNPNRTLPIFLVELPLAARAVSHWTRSWRRPFGLGLSVAVRAGHDGVVEELPGVDTSAANAARIYDYMLGGAHHFAVDRAAGEAMLARFPDAARAGHANRDFLRRAVEYCCSLGIDQFLDLGSGIPTVGNVHEIARRSGREVRVAYVDIEPVAVAHARSVVAGSPWVSVTQADLRDPAAVLAEPDVRELLDFARPVAVLAVASLHYVAPEQDLPAVVAGYRAAMAPGSALVVSHGSDDLDDHVAAAHMRELAAVMAASATPAYIRSRAQLLEALTGFDLVDPGLVDIRRWRPDPARSDAALPDAAVYGAVGLLRRNRR